jgi:hypothetical protein
MNDRIPLLDTQDGASYRQAMQGEGARYDGARDQRQPAPVPSLNIGPSANEMDFDSYQFKADHNSPEDRRRQQTFLPRLDGLDQSSFVAQVCLLAILKPIKHIQYIYIPDIDNIELIL